MGADCTVLFIINHDMNTPPPPLFRCSVHVINGESRQLHSTVLDGGFEPHFSEADSIFVPDVCLESDPGSESLLLDESMDRTCASNLLVWRESWLSSYSSLRLSTPSVAFGTLGGPGICSTPAISATRNTGHGLNPSKHRLCFLTTLNELPPLYFRMP